MNLKVEHPPPYQRLAWNFKKSNNDAIKRAIELVNWNSLFSCNNAHEQVVIFNQTLMNMFSNYIPDKFITTDDKDPPCMNEHIKRKTKDKKVACKSFGTNNKNYDGYLKVQTISTELSKMILKRQNDYHRQLSGKLNDPKTSAKAYWSILKTPYNGKKIPLISLILVNNKLISNFKEKANHFKAFFLRLNVFQSLMILLYPVQQILFLMLLYHPFNSKTKIFVRLYVPLTIIKLMIMMIYL